MPFTSILARVDLSDVSKHSRSSSGLSNNVELIMWFVVAAGALWAVLHYWNRYRDKILRRGDSPQSLFLELCRVHRMDRTEKSLLMQAVTAAQLDEPAVVFVNPQVLGAMSESQACRALTEKLFGSDE